MVSLQVPTLAYVSECEPEVQTVYESLICNEFLEVRRKALVHRHDLHETAQWPCMLGACQAVGLPEDGMRSGEFPEHSCGNAQQHHTRTAPAGLYTPEHCVCLKDLATSEEHPALLPPHPAVRARARIIMDHFNARFVPLFYRILVRWAGVQSTCQSDACMLCCMSRVMSMVKAAPTGSPCAVCAQQVTCPP